MVEFITSTKGSNLLIFESHLFNLKHAATVIRLHEIWECIKRKTHRCSASVKLNGNDTEIRGDHNHPPDLADIGKRKINVSFLNFCTKIICNFVEFSEESRR